MDTPERRVWQPNGESLARVGVLSRRNVSSGSARCRCESSPAVARAVDTPERRVWQPNGESMARVSENISTDVHIAVSCHNAGCIGIQPFDNKLLIPNAEKMIALERLHKKRRV